MNKIRKNLFNPLNPRSIYMIILGVKISIDSKKEILKKISGFLNSSEQRYIVTPNPEFLLAAAKDEEFFYILNKADIAIPDGVGLTFAGLLMGKFIKRVSGIDLMYDVCRLAEQQRKSVFLLGGMDEVAKKAALKLKKFYPNLQIAGAEPGLSAGEWQIEGGFWKRGQAENKQLIERINKANPDIIFAALGHVKQEKWIYYSLPKLPSVKIAMGVGGSFDFISGKIKRAPGFIRKFGCEWLWRLMQEPQKRLPRIFNAVVKFPLAFLKWRFINPFFYRPNATCILYKKEEGKAWILLAERRDNPGQWQLPQGGTDGEDLRTAGIRELTEEAGTDKFRPIATFKNLYKYDFKNYGKTGRVGIGSYGYRGQKQGLFIAEFTGEDSDIDINYWDHRDWKWVPAEKAAENVAEVRKEGMAIFMDKFREII